MVIILPSESCIFRLDSKYGFNYAANFPITYTDVTLNDKGFGFNGSSSKIEVANALQQTKVIKSVEIEVYLSTTTEYIIDLDGGTHYIYVNAGTITATGFTAPTIYVNGVVSSIVAANTWYDIIITTATTINADDIVLGLSGANYLDGYVKLVSLYNDALTPQEVADRYNKYTFRGHL